MKLIKRGNSIFTMSKDHEPVAKINSGEQIIFETFDCYNNQIKSQNEQLSTVKMEFNNPATGPLYIEGANVGDILKIEIVDIKINDKGIMSTRPGAGVLSDLLDESMIRFIPINNNKAIFNDKIEIPVNPMIGVIGVAPEGEEVKTTIPGVHGGNMDCKRIVKGSVLYLPVFIKGALLSIGDLHAVMGDGEIVI